MSHSSRRGRDRSGTPTRPAPAAGNRPPRSASARRTGPRPPRPPRDSSSAGAPRGAAPAPPRRPSAPRPRSSRTPTTPPLPPATRRTPPAVFAQPHASPRRGVSAPPPSASPPSPTRRDRPPAAVRVRPGHHDGAGRRPLREAPPLRPGRHGDGGERAAAIRGLRPLRAGRPVAALGAHRADVRSGERQARLFLVDGVPHRAVAGQQRRQPPARPSGDAGRRQEGPRLDRPARARARRRPGQRRPGPPGGLLPRLLGHAESAGHGLRPALRVRHLPPNRPRRPPARAAGQLAALPGPLGGGTPPREGGGPPQLLLRTERRELAGDPRQAVHVDRRPVRPPGRRLRGEDDQHPAPVGRGDARLLRLPGVQPGRFRGRAGGDARGGLAHPRTLPRRLHESGQGLRFVQEYFLVACSLADLLRRFRRGNADWEQLPERVAIQLNDTHPGMAVPS